MVEKKEPLLLVPFPLIPLLSPPCILGFLGENLGFGAEDGGEGTVVFSVRERMNERNERKK